MVDQTSGEARREQILQTAQKLFAEQGYRETNLNDVAKVLGFRRQALYHYFTSKDEILLELITRAGVALEDTAALTFGAELSPAEKLTEVVRNHVRQVLQNIDIFRIQFEELPRLPGEQGESARNKRASYVRAVANVIAEGQREGSFVDVPPATQALLIIGMCNWTTEWYGPRTQVSIEEIAEHAARTAVQGVLRHGKK